MAGTGSGYINAVAYGGLSVTTYDGSYTGLAAAVAALGSTGGEIYLGPGTYTITSTITVNGPIRFIGGGLSTILSFTGASGACLSFGSGSAGSEVTALRINGTLTTNNQTGILTTQRIFVQKVKFSGSDASHGLGTGVQCSAGSDFTTITDCEFERLQGTTSSFGVYIVDANTCRITNSTFNSTSGLHGVKIFSGVATVTGNLVVGCHFTGFVGRHVLISTNTTYAASHNRILNCVSTSASMTTDTTSGAFEIGQTLLGTAASAGKCYLNTIDSCTVTGSGAYGIQVIGSKANLVRNCVIQGAAKHGLSIAGAAETHVKDVTIYDVSTAAANTYDGVNISNPTQTGNVLLSSNCVFENVMVKKSPAYATAWRYAFNHVDSATPTQAVALEFRDCQGVAGTSGTYNNIPSDVRYIGSQVVDYATGLTPTPVFTGQVTITTPTAGSPLTVSGSGGSLQVNNAGDVVTSGTFESSDAIPLKITYAGTAEIRATDAAGLIHLNNSAAGGTGLVVAANNNVLVGTTSTGTGQKFIVSGTGKVSSHITLGGNATLAGNLTQNGYISLAATTQTEALNNTTITIASSSNILLSNGSATSVATISGSPVAEGLTIFLVATNGNTTIKNNASIKLSGAADYVMGTNDTLTLRYTNSLWIEVARGNV